jgi:hypothetical protein
MLVGSTKKKPVQLFLGDLCWPRSRAAGASSHSFFCRRVQAVLLPLSFVLHPVMGQEGSASTLSIC